jgi:GNAT superfamily N-acetyltransferase
MKIEIRRARPDEAETLSDLSMRSKRSNGYDDAFMEACREELTVTPSRMAEGEYWAAETDVICGCACLVENVEGDSGEVHAFFIDPAFQGRGVGRMLWLKIVELAKSKGIVKLHLDADPFAVPFYEAMGFVVVGEAPSGSIIGRTIPRMEIQLS